MSQVVTIVGYDRIRELAAALPLVANRTSFIFVRHGETEGNRNRVFQVPHIPLNEVGEAQAQKAAAALAKTRIGRVVASPMVRAWRTASLIAAEHKIHPEADGALAERYYVALWDTPVVKELDWAEDPSGCEPISTFVHRTATSLLRILADDTTKDEIVVVAHGGSLLVACALTGVTLSQDARRNAVPLRFARESGGWSATPMLADDRERRLTEFT
jgi:broad specificity phosphatase PhoE